ncbi:Ribonuclease III [Granulibacter bethesdensis]|uniref:Ribonuclease 3 n=2 Tax=Granulibacter bethesdensis TaxID=364410 RepID=A0AAN0RDE8_9PROT|nr:Ribonuclease III [Granulibacter bethesdensis]
MQPPLGIRCGNGRWKSAGTVCSGASTERRPVGSDEASMSATSASQSKYAGIADRSLEAAEALLSHRFARRDLLAEALTHRSAVKIMHGQTGQSLPRGAGSNERLEFVGDRVLGLVVAEWLVERFPLEQEGELGRRLAHLVSQPVLAGIAEQSGLPQILSVAPGEAKAGVRKLATVLSDAMEALIGALYLDAGLDPARQFIRRHWEPVMQRQTEPPKDAKTALQEWAQGLGLHLPTYRLARREGPPHNPVFWVEVLVGDHVGQGQAGSKRAAEQLAAQDLLGRIRDKTGPDRDRNG